MGLLLQQLKRGINCTEVIYNFSVIDVIILQNNTESKKKCTKNKYSKYNLVTVHV
jgi:hypothetical protein